MDSTEFKTLSYGGPVGYRKEDQLYYRMEDRWAIVWLTGGLSYSGPVGYRLVDR